MYCTYMYITCILVYLYMYICCSVVHGQKVVASYAGRINIHQFEARCLGELPTFDCSSSSSSSFPFSFPPSFTGKPMDKAELQVKPPLPPQTQQHSQSSKPSLNPLPPLRPPLPGTHVHVCVAILIIL